MEFVDCRLLERDEIEVLIEEKMIPEKYKNSISRLFVFSRLINDEFPVSVAIFDRPVSNTDELILRYVFVHSDYRNRGLSKEIISSAVSFFRQLKIKNFYYEMISDGDNFEATLIEKLGFKADSEARTLYCYIQGHFAGAKIELLSDNYDKSGYEMVTNLSLEDTRLRRLFTVFKEEGIEIHANTYDPPHSVITFKNNELKAALFSTMRTDGNIMFQHLYFDKGISEQMKILPFMMGKLFDDKAHERKENRYIFVDYKRENVRNAIEAVFGKAEEKKSFIRYKYTTGN